MLDGPQIWRDSLQWEELALRQEEEAAYRARFSKHDVPSREHGKKFTCWRCHEPLGYQPADGIDGNQYHPLCAINERKERATKAADAAD